MRLLIVTQHLSIVGGIETYLRALLPLLVADGFEVGVLGEHGEPRGGILAACPEVPGWTTAGKSLPDVVADVERWEPEVIYTHGIRDSRLEATLASRFPTVLYAHTYHGTCISGTKCHSQPGWEPCQRALGLGCLAAYLPRGCGGKNPLTMIGLYREQRRRRSSLSAFRKVLVASHHMADEYRRHGVEDERLGLVPLFPPDMTPDPLAPKAAAKSGRIVFIGRVNRLKGVFHLLEALPRAAATLGRKLHLVVCGDGPDRAEAEAAARASGLAVDFLGWVNAASRTDEMRRAELLAVPSVWPEPFGLVGLEAGCVGLPAVGFATGGIPDWLVPGVSGESAPGHRPNPSELADAVVRALADDTHRHRLAVGAWETARRFTAEAHFSQLSQLLRSIPEQLPSSRRPQTLGRS